MNGEGRKDRIRTSIAKTDKTRTGKKVERQTSHIMQMRGQERHEKRPRKQGQGSKERKKCLRHLREDKVKREEGKKGGNKVKEIRKERKQRGRKKEKEGGKTGITKENMEAGKKAEHRISEGATER